MNLVKTLMKGKEKEIPFDSPFLKGMILLKRPRHVPLGANGSEIGGRVLTQNKSFIYYGERGAGRIAAPPMFSDDAMKISNSMIKRYKRHIGLEDKEDIFVCFFSNDPDTERTFLNSVNKEFGSEKIYLDTVYFRNSEENVNFIYRDKKDFNEIINILNSNKELTDKNRWIMNMGEHIGDIVSVGVNRKLIIDSQSGRPKILSDHSALTKLTKMNETTEEEEKEALPTPPPPPPPLPSSTTPFSFSVALSPEQYQNMKNQFAGLNENIEYLRKIIELQRQQLEEQKGGEKGAESMEVDAEVNVEHLRLIQENEGMKMAMNQLMGHIQQLTNQVTEQHEQIETLMNHGQNLESEFKKSIEFLGYQKSELERANKEYESLQSSKNKMEEKLIKMKKVHQENISKTKEGGDGGGGDDDGSSSDDINEDEDERIEGIDVANIDIDSEKSNTTLYMEFKDEADTYYWNRSERDFTMGMKHIPKDWRHPAQNEIFYRPEQFNRWKDMKKDWTKFSSVDRLKDKSYSLFWSDRKHKDIYVK